MRQMRADISHAVAKFGRLDIFFANAGIGGSFRLEDTTGESFMRTMKINAFSVFLAIKYAAQAMKAQSIGGSIIATASVAGLRSGAGGSDYSASKAAVINLVRTSAWQLSGTNIRGSPPFPRT
jgi:NAD(P)-dependent dehydrogenase (short-subunit alcohol dehydrogenase family)